MIRNDMTMPMDKIPSVKSEIYIPVEGASYCHHAYITHFKDRFFAMWSCGIEHEDSPYQWIMISDSPDAVTWSEPRRLVSPCQVGDEREVLTAGGFYVFGSVLYAYFGCYGYVWDENGVASHTNTRLLYMTSKDGFNFSEAKLMNMRVVPNQPPRPTRTGRLILSSNISFPYSDDPCGVGNYTVCGIYGDTFGDGEVIDDSHSIVAVTAHRKWSAPLICEGAFFETDDGTLHMLLRSNENILWCTESRDNGESWCEPFKTGFSDDGTKFDCGRLPDGRFYVVSNAVPKNNARNPLVLSISEDGELFDSRYIIRDEQYDMRFEGGCKIGLYAYPNTLIKDGYMYVIYSKQKEAVEVTRIALEDIK